MKKSELYEKIKRKANGFNIIPAWELFTVKELQECYRQIKQDGIKIFLKGDTNG